MSSAKLQQVVRSGTVKHTPQWFSDTFKDSEGFWKQEEIWEAVKDMEGAGG